MDAEKLSRRIEEYISECNGLKGTKNTKCSFMTVQIINDIRIFHNQKRREYNKCLRDANNCQREACTGIFKYLTEMPSCMEWEKRCITEADKNLSIVENFYIKLDKK